MYVQPENRVRCVRVCFEEGRCHCESFSVIGHCYKSFKGTLELLMILSLWLRVYEYCAYCSNLAVVFVARQQFALDY